MITLRGWAPLHLCMTSSGDLLVSMIRVHAKESKVARYSGPTEIQIIQWDEQDKALYSSDINPKHLSENRNLDICVADWTAGAVVVVSAAGKLRFRYTGPPPPPTTTNKKPFKPSGITTDSQGKILASETYSKQIHILDENGYFLHYIDVCGLQDPILLCVDSRDNIFVAERRTGKVKKKQYYK